MAKGSSVPGFKGSRFKGSKVQGFKGSRFKESIIAQASACWLLNIPAYKPLYHASIRAGLSIQKPTVRYHFSPAILFMAHLCSRNRNRNRYRGRIPCFFVDFGPDPDLDPDSGCHN
jgi:hypothetical protein